MKALLASVPGQCRYATRLLLVMVLAFGLAACGMTTQRYIPLEERAIIEPTQVNGQPQLSLDDWLHNYKIRVLPKVCSNPESGFRKLLQEPVASCARVAEDMMDRCTAGKLRDSLPQAITTVTEANNAGTFIGVCVLTAYREKLTVEGRLPAKETQP